MANKARKGTFFKKSFISKENKAATVANVSNNTDENTTTEDTNSIHSVRRSSCKLTQYKSSLDDRNYMICNENKYETGRKVSLLSMTLRKHGKENHQAEKTLAKFANIHIQNDTKYKDTAQNILLLQNVSTLFAANVSYHKDCCQSFRCPCSEGSAQKSKSDKITHDDQSTKFFKMIYPTTL